jgi:hypothetical protein
MTTVKTKEIPAAPKKPQGVFDALGNLEITLDRKYCFRQPRGRDLVSIQQRLSEPNIVDIQVMVAVLATLSLDSLTEDDFLDLSADVLVDLGEVVTKSFRIFSKTAV